MTTLSEILLILLAVMAPVVPRDMKEPFWGSPMVGCRVGSAAKDTGRASVRLKVFALGPPIILCGGEGQDGFVWSTVVGRHSVTQEEQKWRSCLGAQATSGTQVRQPLSRHRLEVDFCRREQGEGGEGLWVRGHR